MSNLLGFRLTNHPKVIETGLGFIIMGQYYTKADLDPVSLEGQNIDGGDNILNLHNVVYLDDTAREGLRDRMFKITKDEYFPDRYYFVVNGHYSDYNPTFPYLCVSEEKDDKITILATLSGQNKEWYQIVDQDNDFIYITWRMLDGHTCGMSRIDKEFFTETEIFSIPTTTRSVPDFMFKDEVYIFISVRNVNATIYLFRYNKSAKTFMSKMKAANQDITFYSCNPTQHASGSWYERRNYVTPITHEKLFPQNCIIRHDDCYASGNVRAIVIPQRYNQNFFLSNAGRNTSSSWVNSTGFETEETTADSVKHWGHNGFRYSINTAQSNRNHGSFILNPDVAFENNNWYYALGNNYKNANFTRLTHDTNYNTYRYWIIDNKYLCLMMYEESNGHTGHITYQGILVCTIESVTNITPVALTRVTTAKEIITMCYTTDKKVLLIGYKNEFELYKWDGTKYIPTNIDITDVVSAGFDMLDRLWYQKTDGSVHTVNLTDPQTISLKFEKGYYTYIDENIDTYVTFSALDHLGDPAHGIYELELSGNIIFTDTGEKTYRVQYSGEDIQVNVSIVGPKTITCKTTFISP